MFDVPDDHEYFMRLALAQAAQAQAMDEVPIGAVLIDAEQKILARGCNQPITACDPTAHAEIMVLREAARQVKNYRLLSTTLYVTLEPCVMCMGALIHARVARIVFGAPDLKWGAAGSIYDFSKDTRFNHQPIIVSGICEGQCRLVITEFFKAKRK
jgi:tRNA(adenine34) deaminase